MKFQQASLKNAGCNLKNRFGYESHKFPAKKPSGEITLHSPPSSWKPEQVMKLFAMLLFSLAFLILPALECQAAGGVFGRKFRRSSTHTPSRYSRGYQGTRTARPVGGYGSNLHRNFVIKQEQLRSAKTGQPPRWRGNVRWYP